MLSLILPVLSVKGASHSPSPLIVSAVADFVIIVPAHMGSCSRRRVILTSPICQCIGASPRRVRPLPYRGRRDSAIEKRQPPEPAADPQIGSEAGMRCA